MDKFDTFHCRRLLKVWLIAIACRTGQLFSSLEAFPYQPYSSSEENWFIPGQKEGNDFDYPSDYNSSYPQSHYWQVPEGMTQDQVQSVIYPDQTSGYYPIQNQQESSFPSSYGDRSRALSNSSFEQSSDSNWVTEPEISSSYEWTSPDQEQPFYWKDIPSQSTYFQNGMSSIDFSPSDVYQSPSSTTSTERSESEKRNFVTFDLPTDLSKPRKDYPLTEEGHAKSYPFQGSDSDLSQQKQESSEETPDDHQETLETPEVIPTLSEGKGQIKIIKKPSETHAESKKNASDSIIGKQVIADPVVGAVNINKKSTKLAENPSDSTVLRNMQVEPGVKPVLPNSSVSTGSSTLPTLAELIAQTDDLNVPPTPNAVTTPPSSPESLIPQAAPSRTLPPTTSPTAPPLLAPASPTPPPPRAPTVITPTSPGPLPADVVNQPLPHGPQSVKEISINFNNVAMIEYIRFISRISNKNFIFDDEELQFNVTIVSEEPTTVENLMTALLQELKIRDLSLIEQGNNIIIHRNPRVRSPGRVVSNGTELLSSQESELVTRVFRLNTLDPIRASEIIRPLLSEDALVEVLRDSNNLIITDLVSNVNKIAQLIGTLDAPNSGVTIGQFVVRNAFVDSLVDLATKILQPIAQGNPFVLVPHPVSNSIFVVSNAFIVEKALAILQNLDASEGRTKILSLEGLNPAYQPTEEGRPGGVGGPGGLGTTGPGGIGPGGRPGLGVGFGPGETGGFEPTSIGPGQFSPDGIPGSFPIEGIGAEGRIPPVGVGPDGFPLAPGGIGAEGRPSAIFDETRGFLPGGIGAASRWARDLPIGHIERSLFFIHKLRFRRGDQIENALRKIGASMQLSGTANIDLIAAINSSQWIESSNALIFTGTAIALEKVRELILELDVPLRQVFIEMLILRTTIADSLSYSVDWIDRFGGGTTTGEQGFLGPTANLNGSEINFVNNAQTIFSGGVTSRCPPTEVCTLPVATGLLDVGGFAAGIIGTHLTHGGTRFSTLGALVRAVHSDSKADILLNPKIITEDNNTAEIFVGGTDRYKTQSITNDLGTLVTNNFQFIDVGTTLRVTPLIGNNGIITLEIIQETTDASPTANSTASSNQQDVNLVEVLTKTRTVTKVHVPNGFFVVLSGMIQDRQARTYNRIPCLGGIPILGCIGKSQTNVDTKSNLMLFIRPFIIDTDEDLEDVTRRQQDVWREKNKFRRAWNYEIDEGLNFLSIKPTDPDEYCSERNER